MGSTSWHDNMLQALLIGLVVQVVAYVLCFICAFLWASWKERMAHPTTGESMAECDVEMGTVNVDEGATIQDDPHALAANSRVKDDGKLEDTDDTPDTRVSTPEIPRGSSTKTQCKNVTEDVKRNGVSVPVVMDVSPPQQIEVLAGKEALFANPIATPRLPNAQYSYNTSEIIEKMSKSARPN